MFGSSRQFQNGMDCECRRRKRLNDAMNLRKEEKERRRKKEMGNGQEMKSFGNWRNGLKTLDSIVDVIESNENEQGQDVIDSIWHGDNFDDPIIDLLEKESLLMSLLFVESLMRHDKKLKQRNTTNIINILSTISSTDEEIVSSLLLNIYQISNQSSYQLRKELIDGGLLGNSIKKLINLMKNANDKSKFERECELTLKALYQFTQESANETKSVINIGCLDLISQSLQCYSNNGAIVKQVLRIFRNVTIDSRMDELEISKHEMKRIMDMIWSVLGSDDFTYENMLDAGYILHCLLDLKDEAIHKYIQSHGLNVVTKHIKSNFTSMKAREELVRVSLHIIYKILHFGNETNKKEFVAVLRNDFVTDTIEHIQLDDTVAESTTEIAAIIVAICEEDNDMEITN